MGYPLKVNISYVMQDYIDRHPDGRTRTGKRKHIDKSHKQKLKELGKEALYE